MPSRPKSRLPLAGAAAAALALVLAACGGSSTPASSSSGSSGASGGSTSSTSTTAASPGTAPAASGAPGPPPVANATDIHKEPLPAAGAAPPPSTLVTVDLVPGTGAAPTASSTVQVQYVGANYADGKVFDASWTRGQPASFPLNGVIPGFSQAILGMKVGGRREVVIPPNLGYGASGQPPAVGPNETLVFVIDLLAVQ